jgi:hypothetical protein
LCYPHLLHDVILLACVGTHYLTHQYPQLRVYGSRTHQDHADRQHMENPIKE